MIVRNRKTSTIRRNFFRLEEQMRREGRSVCGLEVERKERSARREKGEGSEEREAGREKGREKEDSREIRSGG
jgi:hypothetical protein